MRVAWTILPQTPMDDLERRGFQVYQDVRITEWSDVSETKLRREQICRMGRGGGDNQSTGSNPLRLLLGDTCQSMRRKDGAMKRYGMARWMVSIVMAIILIGSLAVTASAVDLRRIVVFPEGTLVEVQLQVVAQSGSSVCLHILSLINAVAIELPAVGTEAHWPSYSCSRTLSVVQRIDGDPLIGLQGKAGMGASFTPGGPLLKSSTPGASDWIGAADVQAQRPRAGRRRGQVALIDTGVDATHPDLRQNIIVRYNAWPGRIQNWGTITGMVPHVAGTLRRG